MFVTNLIKDKKYREFILRRFPKPKGSKAGESVMTSSSIVGNAYELYFRIFILNNTKRKIVLDEILANGKRNLRQFSDIEDLYSDQKSIRNIYINESRFREIKKIINRRFSRGTYNLLRTKEIRRYQVSAQSALTLFQFQKDSQLPVLNSLSGNPFTIYCKNDIIDNFEKALSKFKQEIKDYSVNSPLNASRLSTILEVANVSNPFFLINPVIHFFSNPILKKMAVSFNQIRNPYPERNISAVFYKPSLMWQKVRARPDFIIDNCILDVKTGKSYLPTNDYLQGISYLLFAQRSALQNHYGEIEKLQIYYPFINRTFEADTSTIKLNRKDQKKHRELVVNFFKHGKC